MQVPVPLSPHVLRAPPCLSYLYLEKYVCSKVSQVSLTRSFQPSLLLARQLWSTQQSTGPLL